MRTAEETALLVALLFKRSGQQQVQLGIDTIRCLSRRKHIRGAFLRLLGEHLDDLGLVMMEIDGGGFGLIAASALSGAPAVRAKDYLRNDLDRLNEGQIDFNDIRAELGRSVAAVDEDGLQVA
ncbi:MAG TPA: hypothetical protein VHJ19_06615 [Gammaproteobacteria bacterium]|jgi:hypothetical protein|nr:hypothetical protein [Gammaproteobacteria bacterium]